VTDARGNRHGPVKLIMSVQENPSFPPPEIVSTVLPLVRANEPYNARIGIKGGLPPYEIRLIEGALPHGLDCRTNGELVGIAEESGDWPLRIHVMDSLQQSAEDSIHLAVREPGANRLQLGQFSKVAGVVGERFEFGIPASGGVLPYRFFLEEGDLPPGVELDGHKGILAGEPELAGTWTLKVCVKDDSAATAKTTEELQVRILEGPTSRLAVWTVSALVAIVIVIGIVVAFRRGFVRFHWKSEESVLKESK